MVKTKDKIYGFDRYVPSRGLIDFDAAYYNLIYTNLDVENETEFTQIPYYNKRLKYKKSLEKIGNLNQRIFKTSWPYSNITSQPADRIWPCIPRKKSLLSNERILDLPDFNRGFHLHTIDWGLNDIIAISVTNRIVVGGDFSQRNITIETVTEFEDDIGTSVCWSADGVHLAVGTKSGLVQVWNWMKCWKLIMEQKCCTEEKCTVTSLQWHPVQHSLAWACSRGKITRRDFRENTTTEVEFAHGGCVCNLKYSPQANYLCSSGQDGYVRIWRGDSCEPYMEIEMTNPVRAIAWHPWRSGLLAIGEGLPTSGPLSIWNVNTAKMQYIEKPSKPVAIKALEFNKLSGELVCSRWVHDGLSEDKKHCEIMVLGGPDYVVDVMTENHGCVTSLLWSPDGTKLGTAGSDETFKIWKFHNSQDDFGRKYNQKYGFMALNESHCTVR